MPSRTTKSERAHVWVGEMVAELHRWRFVEVVEVVG